MNNQLSTFNFEGANVQAITDANGELWFVAKDICDVLGLTNPTMALANLDDDERAKLNLGRQGETNIISESGLYSLITGSRKPEAKKFKKWVNSEVLPSIRKTGSYSVNPTPNLNDPALLRTLLLDNVNKVIELQSTIEEQAPKVEALARLSESNGSLCLTDAAKTLKIPRHKLITYLSTTKHIYKRGGVGNWIAYQPKVESKVLEHRTVIIQRGDGTETNKSQVLITPKGLVKFAKVFSGASAK